MELTERSLASGTRSGRDVTAAAGSDSFGDSPDIAESVGSDVEPECSTQSLLEAATGCDMQRLSSSLPKGIVKCKRMYKR